MPPAKRKINTPADPDVEPLWVDAEEIAKYLRLPVSTIYRWSADGTLPVHKAGRLNRYVVSEIKEWIETNGRADGKRAPVKPTPISRGRRRSNR